jgi:hypothetical protein
MDKDATLRGLVAADCFVEAAEAQRLKLVAQARSEGCSWEDIGRALGISRQAAWERFRKVGVPSTSSSSS